MQGGEVFHRVISMVKPVAVAPHMVELEDLHPLIAAIDLLRAELGYKRWDALLKFADYGDPRTVDGDGLELLFERLVILWADGLPPSWPISGLNSPTVTQLELLSSHSVPPTERLPIYNGLMPAQHDV